MKLLLVNGNTTQAVTDRVVAEATRCAAPGTAVAGVTARFGASIVSTEAEEEIAGHAVLDALAVNFVGHDAAILAISFDTALLGARQIVPIPVVGMTEASLLTACLLGRRFGLISFGHSSRWMYLDLVRRAGLSQRMASFETIELSNSATYLSEGGQDAAVIDASGRLIAAGADVVVWRGPRSPASRTGSARMSPCRAISLDAIQDEPLAFAAPLPVGVAAIDREPLKAISPLEISGEVTRIDGGFALRPGSSTRRARVQPLPGGVSLSRGRDVLARPVSAPTGRGRRGRARTDDLDAYFYDEPVVPVAPIAEERIQMARADEAALPRGLPRACARECGEDFNQGLRLRRRVRRSAMGGPSSSQEESVGQRCRIPNAATARPAATSAARTTR